MTLGQSQWVGASDDLVLTPTDARVSGAGLWATNSADTHDVRLGLVWSGVSNLLTGTSGLTVNVAPHHYLASKGATGGPYLGAALSGGSTSVTVPAAPSLGSKRVDVIWVRQKDKNALVLPDTVTAAEYGVATGTPGSSPSKPVRGDTTAGFPADATEVGTVTWDSTTTVAAATNAAQCTLATTGLWTVARGAAIPVRSQTERDSTLTPFAGMSVVRLDQGGRVETYTGSAWRLIAPYAEAAGLQSGFSAGSMASGGAVSSAQTFPAGRFTVAPRVTATLATGPSGSAFITARALNVTKDGFDLYIYNTSASTVSFTGLSVQWHAVQMTATSADG
jgi:hypothetical protein